ncbi:hypothetical protein A2U01_0012576, partial [Trifolium medium]|nr:hypothetical protein [Trifolium medium]
LTDEELALRGKVHAFVDSFEPSVTLVPKDPNKLESRSASHYIDTFLLLSELNKEGRKALFSQTEVAGETTQMEGVEMSIVGQTEAVETFEDALEATGDAGLISSPCPRGGGHGWHYGKFWNERANSVLVRENEVLKEEVECLRKEADTTHKAQKMPSLGKTT